LQHEWGKFIFLRDKIRDCDGVILKAFNKSRQTFYTITAKYILKKAGHIQMSSFTETTESAIIDTSLSIETIEKKSQYSNPQFRRRILYNFHAQSKLIATGIHLAVPDGMLIRLIPIKFLG